MKLMGMGGLFAHIDFADFPIARSMGPVVLHCWHCAKLAAGEGVGSVAC